MTINAIISFTQMVAVTLSLGIGDCAGNGRGFSSTGGGALPKPIVHSYSFRSTNRTPGQETPDRVTIATLINSNATAWGREHVRTYSLNDPAPTFRRHSSLDSIQLVPEPDGDITVGLPLVMNMGPESPYAPPLWVRLPVSSGSSRHWIDSTFDKQNMTYADITTRHIGLDTCEIDGATITVEHVQAVMRLYSNPAFTAGGFGYVYDWWYAPSLGCFLRSTESDYPERSRTTTQEATAYSFE